eukprot:scaffold7095_cov260-Pinguiococcus_pyrenoidosus.AAC.3
MPQLLISGIMRSKEVNVEWTDCVVCRVGGFVHDQFFLNFLTCTFCGLQRHGWREVRIVPSSVIFLAIRPLGASLRSARLHGIRLPLLQHSDFAGAKHLPIEF